MAYLATRGAASRALIMVTSMIFFCVRSFPLPRCRPQNRVVMSMLPQPWPEVPADTARVARRAFRKGTLAMRAREELGSWYDDEAFAAAYGVRGKPGISPAQLAMVTVLQFTENLTDRQAADAVRGRLDWKYCLGLALEDEGFDFSVLSEFRARLVAGSLQVKVLDLLLDRLKELGLVKAGGRQRTDSTHVLARIRGLNRLELAGETVRAALEALAAAVPDWLAGVRGCPARDLCTHSTRSGRQLSLRPREVHQAVVAARAGQTSQQWKDRYNIRAGVEGTMRQATHVTGIRRARYSEKHGKSWLGYKVHLSETCSTPAEADPATGRPPAPNLLTSVTTTQASVPDVAMTAPIHQRLAEADLTPDEHAVDAGYTSADLLLGAREQGITLLGPLLADTSPQARSGGYTAEAFTIDFDHQQVTCPQGTTSVSWNPCRQRGGMPGARLVHPLHPLRPAAVPAPTRGPPGRRGRPRRADQPAVEGPVQDPRRGGRHHAPGHPRHRHPPRPLPRPAQDPSGAQRRRCRGQPDPAGRMVDRQTP